MITLTRKKYIYQEPIQIKGEDGSLLVDYVMRITPEENLQIRDLIFDEQDVVDGKMMSKLEKEGKKEELEKLEEKTLKRAQERQNKFEQITLKEEKEKIKILIGESLYLDLIDQLFDFFVKAFVDKKAKQINTMSTHLRKITNR